MSGNRIYAPHHVVFFDKQIRKSLPEGRREEGVEDGVDTRIGVGKDMTSDLIKYFQLINCLG